MEHSEKSGEVLAPPDERGAAGRRALAPRRRRRLESVLVAQIAVGLVFCGIWEAASGLGLINPILLGRPTAIIMRIGSFLAGESIYSRTIYDHLRTTVTEMTIGYAIGSLTGVLLGFTLGRARFLAKVFEPYILAIYSVPKIALAPLLVLVLGIGIESKVGVVTLEVFFLVFFNTFSGMLTINNEYVQLARLMGASPSQITRRVLLPATLPSVLNGLKMGVPFAMIGAIIGEFIASNHGLGWLILYSGANFDSSGLFAAIFFLVAVVWSLGRLVALLEDRLLRWLPSRNKEAVQI